MSRSLIIETLQTMGWIGLAIFTAVFFGGIVGIINMFLAGIIFDLFLLAIRNRRKAKKECALCYASKCVYHEPEPHKAIYGADLDLYVDELSHPDDPDPIEIWQRLLETETDEPKYTNDPK